MIAEKLGSVRSPKADGTVYWCRGLAIFEVLEFTGRISVLIALIVRISEAGDREKQKHYRAWELINSARGATGDGGRRDALRDLNEDYADLSAAPLAKAYLAGVQLPEAGLIWADLAWTKSTGAKFCETIMPNRTVNNRDCPPEPAPAEPKGDAAGSRLTMAGGPRGGLWSAGKRLDAV